MAKVKTGEKKQYEKILDLFQSMGSDTLMVAEIKEKLGDEIKMYRLSTYMYDIKKYSKQAIVPIREGKKVMGYKLDQDDRANVAENHWCCTSACYSHGSC